MIEPLLNLLSQIWQSLLPFFVVNTYESGVVLRFGKYNKTVKEGLHFKIPLIDKEITQTHVTTTLNLQAQAITTRDNRLIAVRAIVKYSIYDIKTYLLDIYDSTDALQDVTQGIIRKHLSRLNYEQISTSNFEEAAFNDLFNDVKLWGILIEGLTITDLVETKSYILFGGGTLIQE